MKQVKQYEETIEQIRVETPLGTIVVTACNNAVCAIHPANESERELPETSAPQPVLNQAARELREYFDKKRAEFTFDIDPRGTLFQKKVWNELKRIPFGETRSYGQIASNVNNPKAARAVGMACNKNPVMIAIPCHRVVGADGSLTGYALGTAMKQSFLDHERNAK